MATQQKNMETINSLNKGYFDTYQKDLIAFYKLAHSTVIAAGYKDEIEWQKKQNLKTVCETNFLREAAWVILCSGFKELYVRRIFSNFSLCFFDWEDAKLITQRTKECRSLSLKVFGNRRKVDAIISIAQLIVVDGFESFFDKIEENPIEELQKLPMVGKITAWHLAKNLGFQVAKADRHLVRISEHLGYQCVHQLCDKIKSQVNDSIPVIDIVLWRYAVLTQASSSNKAAQKFVVN